MSIEEPEIKEHGTHSTKTNEKSASIIIITTNPGASVRTQPIRTKSVHHHHSPVTLLQAILNIQTQLKYKKTLKPNL